MCVASRQAEHQAGLKPRPARGRFAEPLPCAVEQGLGKTAGGRVELTGEQADAWLAALNDVRLALGTALDVSEDMPEVVPDEDPRAGHIGVYHWLTFVQDALVQERMR